MNEELKNLKKELYNLIAQRLQKELQKLGSACTSLGGAAIRFFSKILLIAISRFVLYGTAQFFLHKIHTIRKNIGIISVYIPY